MVRVWSRWSAACFRHIRFALLSLHVGQFKDRVAHGYVSCVAAVGPFRGGISDGSSGVPEPRSPPANQVRGTPTVPSRSNKSRDSVRGAAKPSDANLQAGFRRPAGRKVTTLHDPAATQDLNRDRVVASQRKVPQPADLPPAGSAGNRTRGRLLKNWRVRSRLVLLIAIPTATAVV